MLRRIAATMAVAAVVATAAMAAGTSVVAAVHRASSTTTASYYLSLGDSLAQGVQPNSQGTSGRRRYGIPVTAVLAGYLTVLALPRHGFRYAKG